MDKYQGMPGGGSAAGDFLVELYQHLPLLVVRLTVDGMILGVNPHTTAATGYEPMELVGRNWWALLFPGRLFAQVPKFISPTQPEGILRDHPMTLQTKTGQQRTIAWTRFLWTSPFGWKEVVCIGQDLTDRLTDADREAGLNLAVSGAPESPAPIGPQVTAEQLKATLSADEIEGAFVQPLAVSPPARTTAAAAARMIQQTQDSLRQAEQRLTQVQLTFTAGGLISQDALEPITNLVADISAMCRRNQAP